eukprot:XP_001710003.1 Hypothetical protein GL50803_95687 [Giardia lamblia ATCC 50803]
MPKRDNRDYMLACCLVNQHNTMDIPCGNLLEYISTSSCLWHQAKSLYLWRSSVYQINNPGVQRDVFWCHR